MLFRSWHQDRTVAVRERRSVDGYGTWSIKQAIQHVEPPFAVIAGMATLRSSRDVVLGLGISVVGWLLEVSTYWLLARAFSLDLSFAQTLIVTVAANLATAIPLTPWNVGPYELVLSELLVLLGADRVAVSQYAVGSHVLLVTWISLTGIVAILAIGIGWNDLRAPAHGLPRPLEANEPSARE